MAPENGQVSEAEPLSERAPAAIEATGSAVRAGALSVLHHGATQAIRVATHLVLARFLSAEAFGLMAIVNSCTTAVELFSDLGVGQKIIHSPRGTDPSFLNTAWTIKSGRGFLLWMLTLALAWPVAELYGEPSLLYLVPVVGFAALLGGLTSTAVSSLERRFELDRVVSLQLGSQLLGGGAMIAWAWLSPSIWSLAVGTLVIAALMLFGSHLFLPGERNRIHWERAAAKEVFAFGKWILPATLVYFVLVLSHRLILGKFVTPEVLGLFNIAAFLSGFFVFSLEAVSNRVLLPLFARHSESSSRAEQLRVIGRARKNLLALGMPPLCVLVVFGPEIVGVLYDERYAGAGWMVQVMAAGGIVDCLNASASSLLLARGDSRRHFLTLAGGAGLFVAFLVFGWFMDGWRGVLVALAAAPVARYAALSWGLRGQGVWLPLLDGTALVGAAALVGGLALLKNSLG